MIKFTMNAKELKIMMDKVMTAVNKKVSVPSLKRLYFSIDDKGILKILSTDIDHYVEVRTKNVYHTEPYCGRYHIGQRRKNQYQVR